MASWGFLLCQSWLFLTFGFYIIMYMLSVWFCQKALKEMSVSHSCGCVCVCPFIYVLLCLGVIADKVYRCSVLSNIRSKPSRLPTGPPRTENTARECVQSSCACGQEDKMLVWRLEGVWRRGRFPFWVIWCRKENQFLQMFLLGLKKMGRLSALHPLRKEWFLMQATMYTKERFARVRNERY